VVGDGAGSRLFAYGRSGTADNLPLDGDTVFEIGSITKVLTALILADMDERGEVTMADPVAKYLPASVKVPDYQGTPITLLDLATHTSGLPDLPGNLALNPLSGIDFAVVQFARSKWQVERRIIDISGDGTNNSGRSVTQARDQAVPTGLTINGLAIINDSPNLGYSCRSRHRRFPDPQLSDRSGRA
jgi:Beta-lactamase/Protein of unknown function (DUF1194)